MTSASITKALQQYRKTIDEMTRAAQASKDARVALGDVLREARDDQGLSRTVVARKARMTVAHLAGIEWGRAFTAMELKRLLGALGVEDVKIKTLAA